MTVEVRALSRAAVGSVPARIVAVSLVPLLRILGLTAVFDDVGIVYSCLVAGVSALLAVGALVAWPALLS